MAAQAKGRAGKGEPPSVRRLLLVVLIGTLLWGLVFGWLDRDLWTLRNWAWALGTGVVVATLLLALRYRDVKRP